MGFVKNSLSLIAIPGFRHGDFSLWARSKNSPVFEIPWMGIGDLGSSKIPSKKSSITGLGFGILRPKIPKKYTNKSPILPEHLRIF